MYRISSDETLPVGLMPNAPQEVHVMKDSTGGVALPAEVGGNLPFRLVPDETLVPDARAGLTPSQMVDTKLACQLGNSATPRKPMGEVEADAPAQALLRQPSSRETSRSGR